MKKLWMALAVGVALAIGGCAPGSITSGASVLTAPVDMTVPSKAAYAARASYFGYLLIADKVKKTVPICGTKAATICITNEQMALLKKVELSAASVTLAGVNAVQAPGATPSGVAVLVAAAEAGVAEFKAQADIWKDKVGS